MIYSIDIIKHIKEYNIRHFSLTEPGSSGSPIIDLETNKIIGIHKVEINDYNVRTLIKTVVEIFNNYFNNNNKISIR